MNFNQLMELCSRFHFLVALGLPGSDTKAFSKHIQFQCNCAQFWRRCACHHALMLGTYLKKSSGGFEAKSVTQKRIPSRVGLGKLGKERSKEYCRLAKPSTAPNLGQKFKFRTTSHCSQVQLPSYCSSYPES